MLEQQFYDQSAFLGNYKFDSVRFYFMCINSLYISLCCRAINSMAKVIETIRSRYSVCLCVGFNSVASLRKGALSVCHFLSQFVGWTSTVFWTCMHMIPLSGDVCVCVLCQLILLYCHAVWTSCSMEQVSIILIR